MTSKINDNLQVRRLIATEGVTSPLGVGNASISDDPADRIDAAKCQQQYVKSHRQSGTTAVVAASDTVHIAAGAGTLEDVTAIVETVATGADRTVTIDVKKSTGGGAFATMLSGTIVFDDDSTALTVSSGTISGASYAAGDLIQVTVAVAGAAGNQALGLNVSVVLREDPE